MLNKYKTLVFKIIGWLQILGGIAGILLIANLLLSTGEINGPLLLIFLTGTGLFIFSLYAGKELLNRDYRKGIIYSVVNQILQLVQWNLFGYGLTYSSGAELLIGIEGAKLAFDISIITSSFEMYINSGGAYYVKLNVIAVSLIVILCYLFNISSTDKAEI